MCTFNLFVQLQSGVIWTHLNITFTCRGKSGYILHVINSVNLGRSVIDHFQHKKESTNTLGLNPEYAGKH